jgi:ribosomal protein L40E
MPVKKLILVSDQTGEEIPVRRCPVCETRNKALASTCRKCGRLLRNDGATPRRKAQ